MLSSREQARNPGQGSVQDHQLPASFMEYFSLALLPHPQIKNDKQLKRRPSGTLSSMGQIPPME